jgi:SAM-dependent methyltransferase
MPARNGPPPKLVMSRQASPEADPFDQARYWIDRHDELVGDPRSVGNKARSIQESIEVERRLVQTAGVFADMLDGPKSILDLGCGYGRIAGAFLEHGYDYLGVDVSPAAVGQARESHPRGRFEVGDLRTWTSDLRFGVVSALYVMVHFVEDSEWRAMVTRALDWVAPSGALLLADNFADETVRAAPHVMLRPMSSYVELLGSHGFEFDRDFRDRFLARNRSGAAYWIARRRPA